MNATYRSEDRIWDPTTRPPLDERVPRHLGEEDGWKPGMAPVAVVRGTGHPSHVRINGWPYAYLGTDADGNALYQTY